MNNLIHHHTIYQAKVTNNNLITAPEKVFSDFLYSLVKEIDMQVLIDPVFKYSEHDAWTGLIGIVTSHISFHYWTKEQYVQMDIYSCKEYDKEKAVAFMNMFWGGKDIRTLFIDRQNNEGFVCKQNLLS